ncbi:MAG TPA: hypothetical protein VFT58_00795 [Nitrososphaera sp.]|nr:hypothetical protein [Nitrososphaera sp.]
MRLRYQTGTATFIQLATAMFLIVINNVIAFISACTEESSECAITAMFSLVFIIMSGLWFLAVSAIGYGAEDRRSGKLAYVLIIAELMTIAAAFGFFQHPSNWFSGLSALVIIVLAAWIIVLAWRLSRAKGGRIVHRPRKRLH